MDQIQRDVDRFWRVEQLVQAISTCDTPIFTLLLEALEASCIFCPIQYRIHLIIHFRKWVGEKVQSTDAVRACVCFCLGELKWTLYFSGGKSR